MDIFDKLTQLEQEAADFGFKWENTEQIMHQIRSECAEVSEHLLAASSKTNPELQEEIGDLLHAVFSLCVFCNFDARTTLDASVTKFAKRMATVRQIAAENGITNLQGFTFTELMQYWDEAKARLQD